MYTVHAWLRDMVNVSACVHCLHRSSHVALGLEAAQFQCQTTVCQSSAAASLDLDLWLTCLNICSAYQV